MNASKRRKMNATFFCALHILLWIAMRGMASTSFELAHMHTCTFSQCNISRRTFALKRSETNHVCLSVCLSVFLSVFLSVCLSHMRFQTVSKTRKQVRDKTILKLDMYALHSHSHASKTHAVR